jgi:predicted translin family RNA/ssDNA-binding protein
MRSLDRNEERLGQLEQVVEENKMFIRNMTRRTEKIVQDLVQRNEEFNAEQKYRVDLVAERLKQLKDESEEHRKTVLAMLDRLPPLRN